MDLRAKDFTSVSNSIRMFDRAVISTHSKMSDTTTSHLVQRCARTSSIPHLLASRDISMLKASNVVIVAFVHRHPRVL